MSKRDPRNDDDLRPEIEPGLAGGSGGTFLTPTDSPVHHQRRPDASVSDLDDYVAPEGDDELLDPRSPEFVRLRKSAQRDEER